MTIKARQLYYVLIASVVLLCLGMFAIAYGTDKILGPQASKLSRLKASSDSVQNQETALAKNKKDIEKYKDLNIIAQTIVPQDKDQAEAVREIVNLAAQSGISKLSSITFPSSTLGSTARTPGSTGSPNLTQLAPVKGLTGVYQLQITITQADDNRVPYDSFLTFLEKLEKNRRTAQVSSITVQPNAQDPSKVAFILGINEYIKP